MIEEDGHIWKCIQCPTFENCWKVVAKYAKNDEVVGFRMVYVDGVIIFAETPAARKVIAAFAKQWKCTMRRWLAP
eukprot:12880981-Prorocentrum_lima.AAC.1